METSRTPVFHRYSVIEKIGSGGMGTVYKAHDLHLDRLVALKVLPPGLQEDQGALERFNREARALAHLNHPRVAAVFDADCEGGFPHLVMELIEGENLERVLRKRRTLSVTEVIRIGTDVADALAHIHSHRIVHRDVKTSNIIIEPDSGAVLADFGIAIEASLPRLSKGTLGTPEYMSPEQAEGRELDGRSDIYSLGVVLYECLAGRPPFQREGDSLASLMDLMQRVTTEPVPSLERVCPDVPQWLCAAVMRCLEKNPDDRCASAADLTSALREERSSVVHESTTSSRPKRATSEDRRAANPSSRTIKKRQETTVLTHLEPVQAVACGPNGRVASGSNDGVARVWDGTEGKLLYPLRQHRASILSVAFSRDGRFIATGDRLGKICIWDGGTGRLLHEIDALGALVLALEFSPDGKMLVSGGGDRAVRVWRVRTGKLDDTLGWHQGYVLSASFTDDGSILATSGSDGQVLIWDVGRFSMSSAIQAHRGWAMTVDISADGRSVVSGGADRRLRIWSAAGGTLLHEIEEHDDAVMAAAFSPSGRYIVSASRDGRVLMWDARSGAVAGRLGTQEGAVTSVAFSPDGRQLAAAGDDRTVRVWSLERRGFGPRMPIKRAVAWATIALLALASLGPVEATKIDFGSKWAKLAQSAADVVEWIGIGSEPLAGENASEDVSVADAAPAGSRTSSGKAESRNEEARSQSRRDAARESRVAGPPQVARPEKASPAPQVEKPPRFHPLYGGGSLVQGVAGWTIEVGRLRSIRGATWLVEQYRDMGYRASVIGLHEAERFLVGVGHFSKRSEAEVALRQLRGRELPYRIYVTRLQWDQMIAER